MNRLTFIKRSILAAVGVAAGVKTAAEIPLERFKFKGLQTLGPHDLYKNATEVEDWKWEENDKPGIGGEQFTIKVHESWLKPICPIKPFLP